MTEKIDDTYQLVFGDVGAAYGRSIALEHVSFSVATGAIVGLLGTNGAGKTTTLRAASNLLTSKRGRLTTGDISFQDQDVSNIGPGDLVRQGLVPVLEGRHCFPTLTVEENLITGAMGRSSSRSETKTDLELVYEYFPRLHVKRRTKAGLTSGGEQQMVAIGRALMSRPKLLLLDEPSMGLAPLTVRELFDTLKKLNREIGTTLLIAEQNAAAAMRIAEWVVMLLHGKTVLQGTTEELLKRDDVKDFYLGRSDGEINHEEITAED